MARRFQNFTNATNNATLQPPLSRRLLYRGTIHEFVGVDGVEDIVHHVADDLSEVVPLDGVDFETVARRALLGDDEEDDMQSENRRLQSGWGGTASPLELWQASQGVKAGDTAVGWTKWATCNIANAEATFLYKFPVMVLGFGGTDLIEFSDWEDNLDLDIHTVTPGLSVHEGFFEYQDKVQQCVINLWNLLDSWGIPVSYNVGFSLGGAAATVFSQIHREGIHGLVTFGAPKTRNGPTCTVDGVRYANENDPIASNVMGMMGDFQHDVTTSIRLYDQTYTYCVSDCWLACCPWGIRTGTKKLQAWQSCSQNSGGCSYVLDCLYNFATVHTDYGDYL